MARIKGSSGELELAGIEQLVQQPEDDLPQGAARRLAAAVLAQAHHKRALEVIHIRVPWGELPLLHRLERKASGQWLDLASF